MTTFIDTHCHLNDPSFIDPMITLQDAKNAGMQSVIIPSISINELDSAQSLAKAHDEVFFAFGLHPVCVDLDIKADFRDIFKSKWDLLDDPKCIAIGECGMDFYRNFSPSLANKQEEFFRSQIELSLEREMPLILHIRNASSNCDASLQVARILRDYPKAFGVFHCYDGSDVLCDFERFYFGIGGVVTFKNAQKLQESIKNIGLDRLILETDAPYLAPTPHRGQTNEPKYIPLIMQSLSNLLNKDIKDISRICLRNSKELFRI
ncbi:MAG: TatD family hydrolase [Helicobacter sp.]|nr:TatD family hydrolase [Helicobacter sp.]